MFRTQLYTLIGLFFLLRFVPMSPGHTAPLPEPTERQTWTLVTEDVTATVYNAVPSQCNDDVAHTASMYRLNLGDVLSHRIVAMERTMMAEYGIHYGDRVLVEGAGRWDGEWQVEDTMNKRFAGQHKIDFLVPENIKHGKWENVKLYIKTKEQ